MNCSPKKATWYKVNDVLVKVFESLATNVKLPALISVVVFKFCAVIGTVFVVGGHKVFNTAVNAKFMSDCLNFGTSEKMFKYWLLYFYNLKYIIFHVL